MLNAKGSEGSNTGSHSTIGQRRAILIFADEAEVDLARRAFPNAARPLLNLPAFGSELSPYSVKVRSYFRYKGLPHEWIPRSPAVQAEFQKYAKLPLVPLVVTPEGEGVQDSTPIIERFEASRQEPSATPTP